MEDGALAIGLADRLSSCLDDGRLTIWRWRLYLRIVYCRPSIVLSDDGRLTMDDGALAVVLLGLMMVFVLAVGTAFMRVLGMALAHVHDGRTGLKAVPTAGFWGWRRGRFGVGGCLWGMRIRAIAIGLADRLSSAVYRLSPTMVD